MLIGGDYRAAMSDITEFEFEGADGSIFARRWAPEGAPRFVVLLAHGYGEHTGRYQHVAERLVGLGAVVDAPDHHGHGRSAGERASVPDMDLLAADLHTLADRAAADHPGLPVVVLGHSMGGLVATRYVQLYPDGLTALVLSGPALGVGPTLSLLAELDPIPDIPIDPAVLSRDPAVGEAYEADPLVYHGPFRKETVTAFLTGVDNVVNGGGLGDLPTLWLHGSADQLVSYEATGEVIDAIKGSALEHVVYDGAAHEIFNEINKDQVLDDLVAFLDRVVT